MKQNNEQFSIVPRLTAIAIAYKNPDYSLIADQVLPRINAGAYDFRWHKYDEAEMFSVPDTRIGRRSAPNQVELEGSEETSSCEDFGIDVPLDSVSEDKAKKNGWDPEARATERSTNIVVLDREIRVARVVSDPANYHDDQKLTLAGADKFSDPASDPIDVLETMLDEAWIRPNQLTFGHTAWRVFRQHPKIVKAINRNDGDSGLVSRQAVADLFEVQRILVGQSRVNIKRPGQQAVLNRVWPDIITGQFIDRTADTTGGVTFGFTAQHGGRVAGTKPADMGLRGGKLVRAGESVKELIVARRAGFLIEGVV